MSVNLYTFVDLYDRMLDTAAHLLAKGLAHAEAHGVPEAEMLGWRLIDDMHPFGFQLMVVINFSQGWLARAAGLPAPAGVSADLDAAGFKAGIAEAKAFLATLRPEQFEGRDDLPLTHMIVETMEPTLPVGRWVTVFATTNIYFHASAAYAILRARGVPLGKVDMFAAGL